MELSYTIDKQYTIQKDKRQQVRSTKELAGSRHL